MDWPISRLGSVTGLLVGELSRLSLGGIITPFIALPSLVGEPSLDVTLLPGVDIDARPPATIGDLPLLRGDRLSLLDWPPPPPSLSDDIDDDSPFPSPPSPPSDDDDEAEAVDDVLLGGCGIRGGTTSVGSAAAAVLKGEPSPPPPVVEVVRLIEVVNDPVDMDCGSTPSVVEESISWPEIPSSFKFSITWWRENRLS